MRTLAVLGAALAVASAGPAQAAKTFHLVYTTYVDSTSGPAQTVDALITTDDGDYYGDGYLVTGITGTRGGVSLGFYDNLDEIYYPGGADGYVDSFGLSFYAGTVLYNLYRNGAGDFAYHEFDGSTGRLVFPADISLTPVAAGVPEPATWALMLLGVATVGAGLRRRRTTVRFASLAA